MWGEIIGGALGFLGQERTNAANAEQAARQMEFQREMSGTSYQRAVKDMAAAGLNPMLAYSQGGASTPGGAQAVMGNSAQAGLGAIQTRAATDLTSAQTAKTREEVPLVNSQVALNAASTAETLARTVTHGFSARQVEETWKQLVAQNEGGYGRHAAAEKAQQVASGFTRAQRDYEDVTRMRRENAYDIGEANVNERVQRARHYAAGATLDELGASEGRRYSSFWESPAGAVKPYSDYGLDSVGRVINGARQGFRLFNRR